MRHAAWLLPVVIWIVGAFGCGRQPEPEPVGEPPAYLPPSAQADIFTNATIVHMAVEIPHSGLSALRRTRWGEGDERPTVKATVREGDVVYKNVAVHLKGAAGSFRDVDDQPAMTLNFDKFVPGQSFHGLHKISLNNSVQDPSYLSEKISRELFEAAGVPVPRAGHAFVTLNGRDLGFYVVLEGANKQFLKRYFAKPGGNLYDGGFVRDIDEGLHVNCGDNPKDQSDLRALRLAVDESRRTGTLAPLEKALDVDRFLSMIGMEVLLVHWDGYALNKNNWRVFHDQTIDKMVFIPHGVDQTFGVGGPQRGRTELLSPPVSGMVAAAVLQTPEGRRRYRERVGQLYTNVFQVNRITARIDELQAMIRPALAERSSSAARNQEQQVVWLKQRIVRRGQEVGRQLGAPANPVKFASTGVVRLSGWKASEVRSGDPTLVQSQDGQGHILLGVSVGSQPSSGSWRTRMLLGEGQYRFEGLVRTSGVTVEPGDPRSGAGLRISKGPMPRKLTGTRDWAPFVYVFQVEDGVTDVELICEVKALAGEAFFDAGSLRLTRVP